MMITQAIATPAIVVIREYCFFLYQRLEAAQTRDLAKSNEIMILVADN